MTKDKINLRKLLDSNDLDKKNSTRDDYEHIFHLYSNFNCFQEKNYEWMETDKAKAIYEKWYSNYMQQENGKKIHKDIIDERLQSARGKELIRQGSFKNWQTYACFGILIIFAVYFLIAVPPHIIYKLWVAARS